VHGYRGERIRIELDAVGAAAKGRLTRSNSLQNAVRPTPAGNRNQISRNKALLFALVANEGLTLRKPRSHRHSRRLDAHNVRALDVRVVKDHAPLRQQIAGLLRAAGHRVMHRSTASLPADLARVLELAPWRRDTASENKRHDHIPALQTAGAPPCLVAEVIQQQAVVTLLDFAESPKHGAGPSAATPRPAEAARTGLATVNRRPVEQCFRPWHAGCSNLSCL